MTTWTKGNYSFKSPPFRDGDIVEGGNYVQLQPGTKICSTVVNLTIKGGNFINCVPQPSWDCTGGNWCQKSFCTHENPELIKKGLVACLGECPHRSLEKIERVVDEEEYRQAVALSADEKSMITLDDINVDKLVDSDGVTNQVFRIREYRYNSTVTKIGADVLSGMTVKEVESK